MAAEPPEYQKVSLFVKLKLWTLNHMNIKGIITRIAKFVYVEPSEYQRSVELKLCMLKHQNIKRFTVREAKFVSAEPSE